MKTSSGGKGPLRFYERFFDSLLLVVGPECDHFNCEPFTGCCLCRRYYLSIIATRRNVNIQTMETTPEASIIFSIALLANSENLVGKEFVCILYVTP